MSEWITDRRPTKADADGYGLVWITEHGRVVPATYNGIAEGTAWMPIERPDPYVKPKQYGVRETYSGSGKFAVYDTKDGLTCSIYLPTREAAERIAAIYEEVMP